MALDNPIEAYLRAVQMENQNRTQATQDAQGMGQNLSGAMTQIAQMVEQQKKKQLLQQIVMAMKSQGQPQQGPQPEGVGMGSMPPIQGPAGYAPPGVGPGAIPAGQSPMMKPPTSGVGTSSPDQSKLIDSLMMQYSPELGMKALYEKQDPYKQALSQQALAEAESKRRPPKPPLEWMDTGRTTDDGKAIYMDKTTGQERIGGTKGTPKPAPGMAMASERHNQFSITQLPSNQGTSTAGGAAYQVKVAARQGMNLIARAGSAQRTGLAQGDLARAILRSSPTDEAMRNANFSDNLTTRWAMLKQKLTADPAAVSNPQIRKEMYGIFKEMDESATPFIQNQLDDLEGQGFTIPEATRKRQMGLTLPSIPFKEDSFGVGQSTGTYSDSGKEARYQAWKKSQGI